LRIAKAANCSRRLLKNASVPVTSAPAPDWRKVVKASSSSASLLPYRTLSLIPSFSGRERIPFLHLGQWIFWINEQANTGRLWDQFLSQLHPFRRNFPGHLRYASDIAAGPAQARNKSELNSIAAGNENYRDCAG